MSGELDAVFVSWVYVAARVFGMIMLLPFWEGNTFIVTRIMIAALCSFTFSYTQPTQSEFNVFLLLTELFLGALFALPVLIFLEFVSGLGELFDSSRGQTLAAQYSMSGGAPEGVSAYGLKSFIWLILMLAGSLEQLLLGLAASFRVIPAGTVRSEYFGETARRLCSLIVYECGALLEVFLPLGILFLIAEIFFIGIQVILPNTSLHAESFMTKTLLGGLFLAGLVSVGAIRQIPGWLHQLLGANQAILLG